MSVENRSGSPCASRSSVPLRRWIRMWFRLSYELHRGEPFHRGRLFSAYRGCRSAYAGVKLHYERGRQWP